MRNHEEPISAISHLIFLFFRKKLNCLFKTVTCLDFIVCHSSLLSLLSLLLSLCDAHASEPCCLLTTLSLQSRIQCSAYNMCDVFFEYFVLDKAMNRVNKKRNMVSEVTNGHCEALAVKISNYH